MSGELRPTLFVATDAPVETYSTWRPSERRPARIVKVGRIWFTVRTVGGASDDRFRIDTLKPHDDNYAIRLSFDELDQYEERVRDAWGALRQHDLTTGMHAPKLHDEDLLAIAEILRKRAEAVANA